MAWLPTIGLLTATLAPTGAVHGYKDGSTALEGYVSYPANKTKAPVVLIVHDWNGLDAYEEGRARQIAGLGYIGFAVDIYGKGVRPKNAQESGAEAGKYYADNALLRSRVRAALAEAKKLKGADTSKIAIMGYCFGGTVALDTARSGADVVAAISFHGGLTTKTPAQAGEFKGRVLVLHGNADPMVPPKDVQALKDEMKAAGIPLEFEGYGDALHAFTVPGPKPAPGAAAGYNEKADKASWERMKRFLRSVFGD